MSTRVRRLITALRRRRPDMTRLRQRAWVLRILASCLVHVAAARLWRTARRLTRRPRHRLSALRRFWTSPDSLTVVLLVRRSPRFAVRIRCRTLDPQFFKSGLR